MFYRNIKIARNDSAVNSASVTNMVSAQGIGWDIRASLYLFTRKAADIISWACFNVMTGDRHDEPAAMDLSPILAALRSSWLVWILTVKPVCIFNDSCFVLFCFWTRNCIYYASVSCVWFLIPCVSCHSTVSVKIFKPRTVHFVFSLRIFVFAHVLLAYNITALGMFTNLCLVLLSQFADSLVPKFHLQLTKKSQRRVREMVGHSKIRQMVWQL